MALLGGSTYHSMFGINDRHDSQNNLAQIRAWLVGVEYGFFDEISMLLYRDLFRLSLQMMWVTGDDQSAFGSLNMIFAGDFANSLL